LVRGGFDFSVFPHAQGPPSVTLRDELRSLTRRTLGSKEPFFFLYLRLCHPKGSFFFSFLFILPLLYCFSSNTTPPKRSSSHCAFPKASIRASPSGPAFPLWNPPGVRPTGSLSLFRSSSLVSQSFPLQSLPPSAPPLSNAVANLLAFSWIS